jgi:hypothetical protein
MSVKTVVDWLFSVTDKNDTRRFTHNPVYVKDVGFVVTNGASLLVLKYPLLYTDTLDIAANVSDMKVNGHNAVYAERNGNSIIPCLNSWGEEHFPDYAKAVPAYTTGCVTMDLTKVSKDLLHPVICSRAWPCDSQLLNFPAYSSLSVTYSKDDGHKPLEFRVKKVAGKKDSGYDALYIVMPYTLVSESDFIVHGVYIRKDPVDTKSFI